MSTLSDSEDEADQRPSFGNPSSKMAIVGSALIRSGSKRKFSAISADGDAKRNGGSTFTQTPTEFVKEKGSFQSDMPDAVRNMMAKMGHKEGTGLGKHSQGRTQIVEASTQRGRRGLGMVVSGLEPSNVDWDFSKEEVIIDEVVDWLPSYTEPIPSVEEMKKWKVIGPTKREIDDETTYCSEECLEMVLNGKSVFDVLEPEEMRRARTRSNPYETIRGAFFLNRAAMKMANMDAILDFMFTNPKKLNGDPQVGPNELLYFADVCAGPGGFSEYVLWRKKGESKGFGLTLRGSNDFKLEDFFAGPPEMFEPHYGVDGLNGDGDIFNPKNQAAFAKFVLENTDGMGVHFVMADGGFSVEGQENIQEILSKQLYLCQFLVAVSILRPGGHFVCKLFDLFTPFSVGLIYLMNMIFEKVAIIKPVTSRPANSERYIVCKHMKNDKESVQQYMHSINIDLCQYMSATSKQDLLHIVPQEMMINDNGFFTYIVDSNEKMAQIQAINLKKIEIFTRNSNLYEHRQSDVRTKCLEKWKIPDKVRTAPGRPDPVSLFQNLMKEDNYQDVFDKRATALAQDTLHTIKCLSSYSCMVRGDGPTFFLMGCGRSNVFRWDGGAKTKWHRLEDRRVELPNQTLLEVQSVNELRGEGRGQFRQIAIHIIDAFFLCGEDVRSQSFEKRQEKLQKFVKALRKPTRTDLTQLHKPEIIPLERVEQIFERLDMRIVKSSANKPRLCYCTDSGNFFHPTGMTIIQTVKEPWIRSRSKSTGRTYWYNIIDRRSVYEWPSESIATVRDCKLHSLHWSWTGGVKVHPDQGNGVQDLLDKEQFMDYITKLRQQ